MLLLAAVCARKLRELPCQERVHALARVHYPPGKAQVGARDSRFWTETKPAEAEEGNLCSHH